MVGSTSLPSLRAKREVFGLPSASTVIPSVARNLEEWLLSLLNTNKPVNQSTNQLTLVLMNLRDVLALAFRTVRSNKLRTGLTVAIIAFGIMALVGIITAIKAMNQ